MSRLAQGDASVNEIAVPFAISQPAISRHWKVLERSGLIEREVDHQRRPAKLKAQQMVAAVDWLAAFRTFWKDRAMKKALMIIVVLLFATGVILWTKGNTMREIRTEIDIDAPAAQVWDILVNIEDWAQWSPIINRSSGNAALGSALSITMIGKEPDKDGPTYSPVITILDKPALFRWRAKVLAGFVMTNDKVLELEKTDAGTRLIHKELFSGMLVPLFWSNVEKNVPAMLDSMNGALKTKAENRSQ